MLPWALTTWPTRRRRYGHILVDEAQFFAPSWFHVVKLSLAQHGQLFLCADPNQGFLKSRLSWKSAGLEVSGRTKKLRRSYRTTRAILETATAVLEALGGQGDREDHLEPDLDGMAAGARPVLLHADSPQDALDRLVNELAALAGEGGATPLGAFLVIYGKGVDRRMLHDRLVGWFGAAKVWWLNHSAQKKVPPQGCGAELLRMAYLDTATGLEAGCVFLIGVERLFFSAGAAGAGGGEQAERGEADARKLYMAMTRAGQRLVVVSSQRLPTEIEALFELDPR